MAAPGRRFVSMSFSAAITDAWSAKGGLSRWLQVARIGTVKAIALLLLFAPLACRTTSKREDNQMNMQVTERGARFSLQLGDVMVTYLSGKESDAQTPVFNMSIGEVVLSNGGTQPINVKYNAAQTFFTDHTFEFGVDLKKSFRHPRSLTTEPTDFVDYELPAGKTIQLSRQDYMALFALLERPHFLDGSMCTAFEGIVELGGKSHKLRFGPHCFKVELDRDWKAEQERYLDFFEARDAG